MESNNEKSFAEKAQEIAAQQKAKQDKEAFKAEEEKQRNRRIANEGPGVVATAYKEIAEQVRTQVKDAPQFHLSAHPRTRDGVEVIVKDRWQLVVILAGSSLLISTYDLKKPHSRARGPEEPEQEKFYKIGLRDDQEWAWFHDEESSLKRSAIRIYPKSIPVAMSNQQMVDTILNRLLELVRK